ncbi:MAG: histidine phosphatase family protein [Synergistaceae bacterium]|jgi:probable phosphoglycerate mutase|nr:histidine phosphatase family protein [Synergistaceae bacterium]
MRLFLVRHGESEWNAEGRFQGQKESDLSQRGYEQGMKAAEFLKDMRFDAVATSPLRRSSVTARKIAELSGCPVVEELEGLTEICHGDWETRLTSEVIEQWPRLFDLWHAEPHTVVMPGAGGESLRDVEKRAVAAAELLASKYRGDVCVVSHDVPIKMIIFHYLNMPLSCFWNVLIANCSLSVLELRAGHPPRLNLLGDAHYLGMGFDLPEQKSL